jgi:hypothetical protein
VLLFTLILPAIRQEVFPPVHLVAAVFLALGFIGLLVSGGMMSLDKYLGVTLWIHRVSVAVLFLSFSDLMIILYYLSVSFDVPMSPLHR